MSGQPDIDREVELAVRALAFRIRQRDEAAVEDRPDPEPMASEYVNALRLRGWRPTPAKAAPSWAPLTGQGAPPERHAGELAEARQAAAEAAAKLRGTERDDRLGDEEAR